MKYFCAIATIVAVIGSGCTRNPTAIYCPAELLSALQVTVNDSLTGALVPNAVLKAVGPHSDSVVVGSSASSYPVGLAVSPGAYQLTVSAAGYAPWAQAETVTPGNLCGQPLRISVRLRRGS
jgi:hypothetical protein